MRRRSAPGVALARWPCGRQIAADHRRPTARAPMAPVRPAGAVRAALAPPSPRRSGSVRHSGVLRRVAAAPGRGCSVARYRAGRTRAAGRGGDHRNLRVLTGAPSRTGQDDRHQSPVPLWDRVAVAAGRLDVHRCRTAWAPVGPLLEGHHRDAGRRRGHRSTPRDQARWLAPGCSSGQSGQRRAVQDLRTGAHRGRSHPPVARRCLRTRATLVVPSLRPRVSVSPAADPSDVRRDLCLVHSGLHRDSHRSHLGRLVGRGVRAGPAAADVRNQMGVGRTA